jgi:hypothetical protein
MQVVGSSETSVNMMLHVGRKVDVRCGRGRKDEMAVHFVVIVHIVYVASVRRGLCSRIDPLLGNDSVNKSPREPTRETIGRLLLGNGSVNKPNTNICHSTSKQRIQSPHCTIFSLFYLYL